MTLVVRWVQHHAVAEAEAAGWVRCDFDGHHEHYGLLMWREEGGDGCRDDLQDGRDPR